MALMDLHSKTDNQEQIFIIDDNPINLGVLYNYLTNYFPKVSVFQDAEEALAAVKTELPDIILLDIMMPEVDGYELCRRIKNDTYTSEIPIIFISALTTTVDKIKGFEAGGVDFITKPFQHEEVLARIRTQLTLQKQKSELERLNEQKNYLLAVIASDIHHPIQNIMELAQKLDSHKKLPDAVKRLTTQLSNKTVQTNILMNNLMDWTKVQMENIAISPKRFDMYDCLERGFELLRPTIQETNVQIKNMIPPDTLVYADEDIINAIIRNVLLNTIRFSDAGSEIEISADIEGEEIGITFMEKVKGPKSKRITVAYGENGNIKRIESVKGKESGMGLLLSRELAEKIGGSLSFNSSTKEGISVFFDLPSGFPGTNVKSVTK